MSGERSLRTVGLTGGIASGKSTIAARLEQLGARVVDGDRLAHEAIEPHGPAYAEVLERFGRRIVGDDRRIDRGRLAEIVFADAAARRDLEALVHPRVFESWSREVERWTREGGATLAVFEAALLVETGGFRRFHRLIVAACSPQTQLARLQRREGMDPEKARRRIEAQWPLARKLAVADYVIDTDTTLELTLARVDDVYRRLTGT